jgi:hypothetical protein
MYILEPKLFIFILLTREGKSCGKATQWKREKNSTTGIYTFTIYIIGHSSPVEKTSPEQKLSQQQKRFDEKQLSICEMYLIFYHYYELFISIVFINIPKNKN